MKTFILALLFISMPAFAGEPYLTLSLGTSQPGAVESIGVGMQSTPDVNFEVSYYHFSDINNPANPVLADLSFNPTTKKCNTNPCKTETGNSHSKSDALSIAALLKNSPDKNEFYFIHAGLTYSRNNYSVDYAPHSITSSWSSTSYEFDPVFGLGYNKNHLSFEVDGYPAMYYYSRSLITVVVEYKFY